jgi:1-acyl-sn-glycerol-3-phosphate acyltransferase
MMSLRDGWRATRHGIAFVTFGVGALLLSAVVFPLLGIGSSGRRRELRVQRAIHVAFRLFVGIMRALGLIRVTWRGRDHLEASGGYVIVANHPTLIDVVLLIACLPQADCVVKKAAWRNPYLRRVVEAAGYIANDAGPDVSAACAERVRRGGRLLLFPEGTRSPRAQLGGFYRGAARVALASGCDILPVVIRCEPLMLAKGEPWFRVPPRAAHFTLEVQAPVSPRAYTRLHAGAGLAARRLTDDLRHLFEQGLRHATA